MSINAANVTYLGTGPAGNNQVLAWSEDRGSQAQRLSGYVTFTGDSASSSATMNYLDGTNFLAFTPKVIMSSRVGGSATATVDVVSVVDSGSTNAGKTATIQFSTSFSGTVIAGVEIYPA